MRDGSCRPLCGGPWAHRNIGPALKFGEARFKLRNAEGHIVVDIGAIAGLTSSIKSISDIAKTMIGMHDAKVFQAKANELLQVANDALHRALETQTAHLALLESERELKRQLAQVEDWAAEKQRYELTEIGFGVFAYAVKEAIRGAEPPHCLCAHCYQKGEKSILQTKGIYLGQHVLRCDACKSEFAPSEERSTP